jgi:hypothetical protein
VSFRVLVIPEDPTYNGYILQPIVERMLTELGKPNAHVKILTDPKVNGYPDAVNAIRGDLIERYRYLFNLWLFLPDADRAGNLEPLESALGEQGVHLLCCAAVPEVEIWLLAGHRDKLPLPWADVRKHPHLKEDVFEPFLRRYGDAGASGGRKRLTLETLANYRGLVSVCEELGQLENRLRTFLARST